MVTAHGEGRALFGASDTLGTLAALRYVDSRGHATEHYPENPICIIANMSIVFISSNVYGLSTITFL